MLEHYLLKEIQKKLAMNFILVGKNVEVLVPDKAY